MPSRLHDRIAARSFGGSWRRRARSTAADVASGASHGDPTCVELLTNAGRLVGHMLASVVNFFNPSLIVIGGGVAGAGDQLLATIRETVYRRSLPLATRELVVKRSELGDRAGVVGAAAIVTDELFRATHLRQWLDVGTSQRWTRGGGSPLMPRQDRSSLHGFVESVLARSLFCARCAYEKEGKYESSRS